MGNDVAAVAAVFLFPHTGVTGESEQNLRRLVFPRVNYGGTASYFGLMTKQVGQLVREADQTYLVVTENEAGETSEISPRFRRHCCSAKVIKSGMVSEDNGRTWTTKGPPDYALILDQITEGTLIIGGFHVFDSILDFVFAARKGSREVFISPRTTDLLYWHYEERFRELPYRQPLDRMNLDSFLDTLDAILEVMSGEIDMVSLEATFD